MSGSIEAVEMVRRIRDAHYERLRGKSPEERIAFYRSKAGLLQAEIAAQRPKQTAGEPQRASRAMAGRGVVRGDIERRPLPDGSAGPQVEPNR